MPYDPLFIITPTRYKPSGTTDTGVTTSMDVFLANISFSRVGTNRHRNPRKPLTGSKIVHARNHSATTACYVPVGIIQQVSEREVRARGPAEAREDPRGAAVFLDGARISAGGAQEGHRREALGNWGGGCQGRPTKQ